MIVWIAVIAFLTGMIWILTGCAGEGYYAPPVYGGGSYYQQPYNPYQYPQIIQPLPQVPFQNLGPKIDTTFHPAPLIGR